jgi:hypothetical protein
MSHFRQKCKFTCHQFQPWFLETNCSKNLLWILISDYCFYRSSGRNLEWNFQHRFAGSAIIILQRYSVITTIATFVNTATTRLDSICYRLLLNSRDRPCKVRIGGIYSGQQRSFECLHAIPAALQHEQRIRLFIQLLQLATLGHRALQRPPQLGCLRLVSLNGFL